MNITDFFEELKGLPNVRPSETVAAEKIKSHNLPVIIFGAATTAKAVTEILKRFYIEVEGYAVDAEYYKPNQTYLGKPVYNFDELHKTPEKYVFVLGMIGLYSQKRYLEFMNDDTIIKYNLGLDDRLPISREFIIENREKFIETYNLLEDDLSRKTFCSYLKAHVTGDYKDILDVLTTGEYFNDLTHNQTVIGGGYVDCGAYTGDTLAEFIEFTGGNYSKIFAIEPDVENFVKLEKFVREKNYRDVVTVNCGVWNEKTTITFDSEGDMRSHIADSGNITVNVDTIDNIVGDTPIGLIKMDIEGAELNALKGAINTLKKCRPYLALSAYHKAEDLITIPQFIKNIYGDCKFYFRKDFRLTLTGFDLYVVPR